MKPIKNTRRVTRFSDEAATRLYGEANKSDPFATRRMANALSKGHDTANTVKNSRGVADESLSIIRSNIATGGGALRECIEFYVARHGRPVARRRAA